MPCSRLRLPPATSVSRRPRVPAGTHLFPRANPRPPISRYRTKNLLPGCFKHASSKCEFSLVITYSTRRRHSQTNSPSRTDTALSLSWAASRREINERRARARPDANASSTREPLPNVDAGSALSYKARNRTNSKLQHRAKRVVCAIARYTLGARPGSRRRPIHDLPGYPTRSNLFK